MAVKPIKDKATRDKVAQNKTNSPLLKLPEEIRSYIWREVLGSRVIHIQRSGFKGFMYEACLVEGFDGPGRWASSPSSQPNPSHPTGQPNPSTTTSQPNSQPNTSNPSSQPNPSNQTGQSNPSNQSNAAMPSDGTGTTQNNSAMTDSSWEARHPSCLGLGKLSYAYSRQYLTLEVLGVCHQVYSECFEELWGSNLFSFTDSATFKSFLGILRLSQKRSLRNLQISLIDPRNAWVSGDVAKLRGLRNVELCISENWLDHPKKDTRILESLRKLPLEHVNVTIKLDDDAQNTGTTNIKTPQERDEIQKSYRLLLLSNDPSQHQSGQGNTAGTIITSQNGSTQDEPGPSDPGHSTSSHSIPDQGDNNNQSNNQSNMDPNAVGQKVPEQSQTGQSSPIGNVVLPEGTTADLPYSTTST